MRPRLYMPRITKAALPSTAAARLSSLTCCQVTSAPCDLAPWKEGRGWRWGCTRTGNSVVYCLGTETAIVPSKGTVYLWIFTAALLSDKRASQSPQRHLGLYHDMIIIYCWQVQINLSAHRQGNPPVPSKVAGARWKGETRA